MCELGKLTHSIRARGGWVGAGAGHPFPPGHQVWGVSLGKLLPILDAKSDLRVDFIFFCLQMTNSGILMHMNATSFRHNVVISRPTIGGGGTASQ